MDTIVAIIALVFLSPLMVIITVGIKCTSKGPIFYKQQRIGQKSTPFTVYKFRSMRVNNPAKHPDVTTVSDPRITAYGRFIRRHQLDKLPQLWNVIKGDMSLVGPKPELEKYIQHHERLYRSILQVRPGMTDMAAILFKNESRMLATYPDPEWAYTTVMLPKKIALYNAYITNISFLKDMHIIFKTIV